MITALLAMISAFLPMITPIFAMITAFLAMITTFLPPTYAFTLKLEKIIGAGMYFCTHKNRKN